MRRLPNYQRATLQAAMQFIIDKEGGEQRYAAQALNLSQQAVSRLSRDGIAGDEVKEKVCKYLRMDIDALAAKFKIPIEMDRVQTVDSISSKVKKVGDERGYLAETVQQLEIYARAYSYEADFAELEEVGDQYELANRRARARKRNAKYST